MSTALVFCLLGLGVGAMYAALAVGVVLVHRGTGIVNFALGAQAMFPAVVFAELRTSGELILPLVVVPDRYDIGEPRGLFAAALIAVVVGALVSVVGYLLIFRPLRESPPLSQIVATVGFTIVLQGLAVRSFGTATVRTPAILPSSVVEILGRPVPVDRFWLTGAVLVAAAGLTLLYRFTRFGLATTAAAGNEKGIVLLGYDPARLGMVNWALASVLVSAIGIVVTSLSGVNPFNYSLFVIPALAAALAGRLRSIPVAAVAGLGIGSFEALAVHLVGRRAVPSFLWGGLDSLVPLLVIVVTLLVTGTTVARRGVSLERHHVSVPLPTADPRVWALGLAIGLAIALTGDSSMRLGLIQSSYVAIVLLSIVVITGYVGQLSLAQLAFAGCSAFLVAEATGDWGLPFPLGPVLAVAITTAAGTLVGAPALRIRGIQYAIVTFAAALVFERLVFRSPALTGDAGLARVANPELFGVDLGILAGGEFPSRRFAVLTVIAVALMALLVARIRRSPIGRRFLAVRINERAAAACGVDVAGQKLAAAATASFIAAVAGVVFAYKNIDLSSAGLGASEGLELVGLAFLGGIGSVAGALIGGFIAPSGLLLALLSVGAGSENLFLATGVGLVLVTLVAPDGLAGVLARLPSRRVRSSAA